MACMAVLADRAFSARPQEVEQLRHQVHEAEARVARLQQARQELVNQAALAQS